MFRKLITLLLITFAVTSLFTALNVKNKPTESEVLAATSGGYWTTKEELTELKQLINQGREPFVKYKNEIINKYANAPWPGLPSVSGTYSVADRGTFESHFHPGGYTLYAKAIAYVLTSNQSYAEQIKVRLLDLTDITSFSGNDSAIMLGWQLPAWIQSAELISDYPGWTGTDKRKLQKWFAEVPYRVCSKSGRIADNNWGATCSYLNAMIADYIADTGWELHENLPVPKNLSPAQAYSEYTEIQLKRMNYKSKPMEPKSNSCLINGIMPHGGIPAELRRARGSTDTSWCTLEYLPDLNNSAYTYQITHLAGTIPHAELALRRGDKRIYDNIAADKSGSLLRAIKFIITNPVKPDKSYDWKSNKKSLLHMANRYYKDPDIASRLEGGNKNTDGDSLQGLYVYFTKFTHSLANASAPRSTPTRSPIPITPTPTSISQICDGTIDVDGNGKVTIIDFMWVVIHFGQTVSRGVREGDLNCDGRVTIIDYMTWVNINYAASLKR